MSARRCLPLLFTVALLAAPAAADEPKSAALAYRLWAVSDAVLEQHVNPPSRQEMLLAVVRALASEQPAGDLARRVSAVTTEEQFAKLLDELHLPLERVPGDVAVGALLTAVPGQPPFLPAGNLRALEQIGNNRYVGTGIQIRFDAKEELTQIVAPFPGGPARKAGAKPGDLIVAVDGVEMKGKKLQEVVDRLRGEEGTKVSMAVRQPGEKETRTLDMVRSVVPFETAVGCRRTGEESWEFRPDSSEAVGYVRVLNVTSSTASELTRLEPRLREEGAKALVLDLRTAQATQFQPLLLLADALLDGGVMWKVRDGRNQVKEYKADRDCAFRGWPMAVLVDAETDPMTLLLAAALQDAGRAVVVGEESTRPAGWVTSLVKFGDGQGGTMLRSGIVERPEKAVPRDRPIRLADALAGGWSLRPDHQVTMTRQQKEAVAEHHAIQDRLQTDGGKAPDDPQLAKARAVLLDALKAAPSR